jgi:isoleucyl-tRNA synthetase
MEKEPKKSEQARLEEEILSFWNKNKIFEKSLEKKAPKGDFVFYDGPPFATGLPHYGHLLQSTIKDIIPRYKTMKGYRVSRRWGWDCHGLPLENITEKELNLATKKDIENFGIEKFNETARKAVLQYADDWKKIIPRIGRWVDMENDYKTMDSSYTESIWWIFKTLYDKGLIYEDYKVMYLCPRCETTLANFEVSQGYKDIKDISVTVKFPVLDEPETFFLAWTTTPWTLPGNVALAVNPKVTYVKVHLEDEKAHGIYIFAKERLLSVLESFPNASYEILDEFLGEKLLGKSYMPIFDFYSEAKDLKDKENGWKVYGGDFVTTDEGTGIVHIAPAFGEDDMNLRMKHKLPFVQHVEKNGTFAKDTGKFFGLPAKPKENHESTDVEIIKDLAARGTLFSKKTITHSYPHCWRCETPLLNYAASSWFVKVTKIRNKLVANNRKIHWVPEHIKEGRFGNWLAGARDWAISRSRFWGAPIPVWKDKDGKIAHVFGSLSELKEKTKRNTYYVLRHGEAESNRDGIVSSKVENEHHLTEKGKEETLLCAKKLSGKKIDFIYTSPFIRTKETAEMLAKSLGIKEENIIFDERLSEINTGTFDMKPIQDYRNYFTSFIEKFTKKPEGGETVHDVKIRAGNFIYDIDSRYKDKNILIVSHEYVIWMLDAVKDGLTDEEASSIKEGRDDYIRNGEWKEFSFAQVPHNNNYELDFHLPYVDRVSLFGKEGSIARVPDVFDCWFESGAMPYGQFHYPFENKNIFNPSRFFGGINFPADFIGEALDQTRGWFYSLLVLSTALFGKPAYKNVIATGLILAEDGQKMSKSLKNYPDPLYMVDTYGADALRLYIISSPVVRGEDLNFSEQGVSEIMRKVLGRLLNVYSFFALQKKPEGNFSVKTKKPALDEWIESRLTETIKSVEAGIESYELDRAIRPIDGFVDDLSTWYLRRSRDRFKASPEESFYAYETLRFVLMETLKIIAPFAPFTAEHIYQKLKEENSEESIHLCDWPEPRGKENQESITIMKYARDIVEEALSARSSAKIKVRQPLSEITVNDARLKNKPEILKLIREEVNVKNITFDMSQKERVFLDTGITPELKEEGVVREIIRTIQAERKNKNLTPGEKVKLLYSGNKKAQEIFEKFEPEICRNTGLSAIKSVEDLSGEGISDGDISYKIKLDT